MQLPSAKAVASRAPRLSRGLQAALACLILAELLTFLVHLFPLSRVASFDDANWALCERSFFLRFVTAAISVVKAAVLGVFAAGAPKFGEKLCGLVSTYKTAVLASILSRFLFFGVSVYPFCQFYFKAEDLLERSLLNFDGASALCLNLAVLGCREALVFATLLRIQHARNAEQASQGQESAFDASRSRLNA